MQFSKNLLHVRLPKGFDIVESVDADGITQTSLTFPFEVLFGSKGKGLLFADKFADLVARREIAKHIVEAE